MVQPRTTNAMATVRAGRRSPRNGTVQFPAGAGDTPNLSIARAPEPGAALMGIFYRCLEKSAFGIVFQYR